MRFKADILVHDCERAITMHSDALQGEDFRLSWFSIICLLRAIGHVLDKVDSKTSPAAASVIATKYKTLKASAPHPEIFWCFIDHERNRFLKEYEHGVIRELFGDVPMEGGQVRLSIDLANIQNSRLKGGSFRSVISSGVYAGKREKQIAIEALNWWKKYIDELKTELQGK